MYNTVMVIDDNQIDLYIAEISIRKNGFAENIVSKKSANDALTYLTNSATDPAALPEIIFLDINMPETNGFEFLEAFENLPEIVQKTCIIMMVSSSLDPEDHKKANENKFVIKFINKPLVKERLREILAELQA